MKIKYSEMSMGDRIRILTGLPESGLDFNDNELLFPQLNEWRNKKCSCKGAASTYGDLPRGKGGLTRCFECFGLFNPELKSFRQAEFTKDDYLALKYTIQFIDEQARSYCHCWKRTFDNNTMYKIGDIVYCSNCGRIAGRVVLE